MRRLLLAVVLALAAAAPAQAGTLLSGEDETDLAQALAEARAEQGICYGWEVTINGATSDVGSSSGPGTALDVSECQKAILFRAALTWTCDSCDGSDSASAQIDSNLPNAPTMQDLRDLGYDPDALNGDEDDTTLVQMVEALPLLAAQRGLAPPVPYETPESVPAADHATGTPGSDMLRSSWPGLTIFGLLLVCGPLWFFYKRGQGTARERRRAKRRTITISTSKEE